MSNYADNGGALLGAFPYALARDEDKHKLAESIADLLAGAVSDTSHALIYPDVDDLPEGLLDILAYDLNVEWYDYEGELSEKRATIRECMKIHKFKGTKAAILMALKTVYADVEVQEWFEYGGEPYHFKIYIKHDHSGYSKLARLLQKVRYYKNLRSTLEETIFEIDMTPPPIDIFVGAFIGGTEREDGAVAVFDVQLMTLRARLNTGYFLYAREKIINLPEVAYGLESNND